MGKEESVNICGDSSCLPRGDDGVGVGLTRNFSSKLADSSCYGRGVDPPTFETAQFSL